MKKILSVITTLALLVSLTACSGEDDRNSSSTNGGQGSNQSSDQSTEQSMDQSSESSKQSSSQSGDQSSEPPEQSAADIRAAIDKFEMDDFPAPDGMVLKKADATLIAGYGTFTRAVGYEFSYVRKVQPVFRNTVDEPNMIDWNAMEFTPALPEAPEDLGYFKIKAGDVLDNGLTVKSAEIYFGHGLDGIVYDTKAEFDGELTLEGVLYCYPNDDYNIYKGDVVFIPNTSKHSDLVTPYKEIGDFEPSEFFDPNISFAAIYSGNNIHLGNESALTRNIADMFNHGNAVKARVTLTNIRYNSMPAGVLSFAEIIDAVEL